MKEKRRFILIQEWMLDKLGLSGAELIVYACIYGFSQDGETWFQGSSGYLAKWAGVSKQQIFKVLKKLVEKKLIEKKDVFNNGVKFCNYKAKTGDEENIQVVNKDDRGSQQSLAGVVNKDDRGSQQSLHHNIDTIYNHNINDNIDLKGDITSTRQNGNKSDKRDRIEIKTNKSDEKKEQYNPKSLELANLLYSLHKQIDAGFNRTSKQLEKWASDIDKINRLDGRSFDDIEKTIRWVKNDDFWKTNIISGEKLRIQFDKVFIKSKSEQRSGYSKPLPVQTRTTFLDMED